VKPVTWAISAQSTQLKTLRILHEDVQRPQLVLRNGTPEMLSTIETVADLSYAWHALAGYKEATCGQYVPAKRPIRWEE
ncbi:unnamed protein product, partial [Durusdinium trenchii]